MSVKSSVRQSSLFPVFGILKSEILLHKLDHLSVLKTFWVYFKNWVCLKNLSVPKTNFEIADGLGIGPNAVLNLIVRSHRTSSRRIFYFFHSNQFLPMHKILCFLPFDRTCPQKVLSQTKNWMMCDLPETLYHQFELQT